MQHYLYNIYTQLLLLLLLFFQANWFGWEMCFIWASLKKNVTIHIFYPQALNLQYFYLHLLLKCVFQYPLTCCQIWKKKSNDKWKRYAIKTTQKCQECNAFCVTFFKHVNVLRNILVNIVILHQFKLLHLKKWHAVEKIPDPGPVR